MRRVPPGKEANRFEHAARLDQHVAALTHLALCHVLQRPHRPRRLPPRFSIPSLFRRISSDLDTMARGRKAVNGTPETTATTDSAPDLPDSSTSARAALSLASLAGAAVDRDVIKVNNANLTELKNACDDALKRVRLSAQSFIASAFLFLPFFLPTCPLFPHTPGTVVLIRLCHY